MKLLAHIHTYSFWSKESCNRGLGKAWKGKYQKQVEFLEHRIQIASAREKPTEPWNKNVTCFFFFTNKDALQQKLFTKIPKMFQGGPASLRKRNCGSKSCRLCGWLESLFSDKTPVPSVGKFVRAWYRPTFILMCTFHGCAHVVLTHAKLIISWKKLAQFETIFLTLFLNYLRL